MQHIKIANNVQRRKNNTAQCHLHPFFTKTVCDTLVVLRTLWIYGLQVNQCALDILVKTEPQKAQAHRSELPNKSPKDANDDQSAEHSLCARH